MILPTWTLDAQKATERRCNGCNSNDETLCEATCGSKRFAPFDLPHPSKKRKLNPLQLDATLDQLSQEIPMVSDWESILEGWDSEKEGDISCEEDESDDSYESDEGEE
mmetsp:Transcript_14083/g.21510  ORF Transcript_14083/g.21510 Transcript_14083/m.21510 type:complete len:108 (-) Transcript_14083:144-467(-)